MPSHNHSASSNTVGSHGHNIYYGSYGNKSHASIDASGMDLSGSAMSGSYRNFTADNGGHSHTISVGNSGSGGVHNNMPPYLGLYVWKRTA